MEVAFGILLRHSSTSSAVENKSRTHNSWELPIPSAATSRTMEPKSSRVRTVDGRSDLRCSSNDRTGSPVATRACETVVSFRTTLKARQVLSICGQGKATVCKENKNGLQVWERPSCRGSPWYLIYIAAAASRLWP